MVNSEWTASCADPGDDSGKEQNRLSRAVAGSESQDSLAVSERPDIRMDTTLVQF